VTTFSASSESQPEADVGSKDGRGCADHDQPYTFGRRPRAIAPFPFAPAQFAHLLALRGRISDGLSGADDVDTAGLPLHRPGAVTTSNAPRLCYAYETCGAMVPGAHQDAPAIACPRCAPTSSRDSIARAILHTAGVLASEAPQAS
jgi:hypothetical protein